MAVGLSAPKTINIDQPIPCGKNQIIEFNRDYQIINKGDQAETYQFSIKPILEEGYLQPKTEWFSFKPSDQYTLEPNKTQTLSEFNVNIACEGLENGKYQAFLQTTPAISKTENSGAQVNYGVGTRIYFTTVGGYPAEASGVEKQIKGAQQTFGVQDWSIVQFLVFGAGVLIVVCALIGYFASKLGKKRFKRHTEAKDRQIKELRDQLNKMRGQVEPRKIKRR